MDVKTLRRRQGRLSARSSRRLAGKLALLRAYERLMQVHRQKEAHEKQREYWALAEEHRRRDLEQRQALLQREAARLPQLIPAWADEEVALREKKEIAAWAVADGGLTREELNSIVSASAVAALRKAMLYDQLQNGQPNG
jgi:hypothetical protein